MGIQRALARVFILAAAAVAVSGLAIGIAYATESSSEPASATGVPAELVAISPDSAEGRELRVQKLLEDSGANEADGTESVSPAALEGYIWLTSHTSAATYSYKAGRQVYVTCTATDSDHWGYYQVMVGVWDRTTEQFVKLYAADSYVNTRQDVYGNVDTAGLPVSSGRYQIVVILWDDLYSIIEDADYFNLNLTPNYAPVIVADRYGTTEDVPLSVAAPGVLANDTDANGDTLQSVYISGPSHGNVSLAANGSFVYTPNANFFGNDVFAYRVYDGSTYSNGNSVTIVVSPVNDPPVATDDSYPVLKNVPKVVAAPGVLANDLEVDGTPMTAVKVTDPAHGTLSLSANGSFTYTPTAGYTGPDSFTYKAYDGSSYSSPVTVLLNVQNTAPVALNDYYFTEVDATMNVAAPGVLENDSDANGDELTAVKMSDPANGILTFNADGSFVFEPSAGFSGTDSFTYKVNDGTVDSDVKTVTLYVGEVPIEDNAAGVTFDRFVPSVGASYSGGTYIYGRWTGTRIESRFTGTKIAWYGPKQPAYGKADVYIDNVKVATVDCYAAAASATLSAKLWESGTLSAGTHVLSIRLTGAKNAASTGNIVAVDNFVVGNPDLSRTPVRVNETAGTFAGAWIPTASTTYTDGTYRYSRWAGAKISYTFTGTKVAWIGPRALNYGRADVYIDGQKKATVSQYGALGWRYRVWESGTLAAGQHTIEIRVLGTKEAASTNTIVVVDGFDVTP